MDISDALNLISGFSTPCDRLESSAILRDTQRRQLRVDLSVDGSAFRFICLRDDGVALVVMPGAVWAYQKCGMISDPSAVTDGAQDAWTTEPPIGEAPLIAGLSKIGTSNSQISQIIASLVTSNLQTVSVSIPQVCWFNAQFYNVALPGMTADEVSGHVCLRNVHFSTSRLVFSVDAEASCVNLVLQLGANNQVSAEQSSTTLEVTVSIDLASHTIAGRFQHCSHRFAKGKATINGLAIDLVKKSSLWIPDLTVTVDPGKSTQIQGVPVLLSAEEARLAEQTIQLGDGKENKLEVHKATLKELTAEIALHKTDVKGQVQATGIVRVPVLTLKADLTLQTVNARALDGRFLNTEICFDAQQTKVTFETDGIDVGELYVPLGGKKPAELEENDAVNAIHLEAKGAESIRLVAQGAAYIPAPTSPESSPEDETPLESTPDDPPPSAHVHLERFGVSRPEGKIELGDITVGGITGGELLVTDAFLSPNKVHADITLANIAATTLDAAFGDATFNLKAVQANMAVQWMSDGPDHSGIASASIRPESGDLFEVCHGKKQTLENRFARVSGLKNGRSSGIDLSLRFHSNSAHNTALIDLYDLKVDVAKLDLRTEADGDFAEFRGVEETALSIEMGRLTQRFLGGNVKETRFSLWADTSTDLVAVPFRFGRVDEQYTLRLDVTKLRINVWDVGRHDVRGSILVIARTGKLEVRRSGQRPVSFDLGGVHLRTMAEAYRACPETKAVATSHALVDLGIEVKKIRAIVPGNRVFTPWIPITLDALIEYLKQKIGDKVPGIGSLLTILQEFTDPKLVRLSASVRFRIDGEFEFVGVEEGYIQFGSSFTLGR